jgi:hypothetical protein
VSLSPDGRQLAWVDESVRAPTSLERADDWVKGVNDLGFSPPFRTKAVLAVLRLTGGAPQIEELPAEIDAGPIEWTPDGQSICGSTGGRMWILKVD